MADASQLTINGVPIKVNELVNEILRSSAHVLILPADFRYVLTTNHKYTYTFYIILFLLILGTCRCLIFIVWRVSKCFRCKNLKRGPEKKRGIQRAQCAPAEGHPRVGPTQRLIDPVEKIENLKPISDYYALTLRRCREYLNFYRQLLVKYQNSPDSFNRLVERCRKRIGDFIDFRNDNDGSIRSRVSLKEREEEIRDMLMALREMRNILKQVGEIKVELVEVENICVNEDQQHPALVHEKAVEVAVDLSEAKIEPEIRA